MSDEEYMLHAMKGDELAVAFCKQIAFIASIWDDLIDRDKEVPAEDVNRMMQSAMLLASNPFYRANIDSFQPVMQQSILNWHIANTLEKEPGRAREIAHVMRYAAADIVVYAAALKGGMTWAREVGPELRLRCQKDTFENFDREMNAKHKESTA
jgi:hypothetical protein